MLSLPQNFASHSIQCFCFQFTNKQTRKTQIIFVDSILFFDLHFPGLFGRKVKIAIVSPVFFLNRKREIPFPVAIRIGIQWDGWSIHFPEPP